MNKLVAIDQLSVEVDQVLHHDFKEVRPEVRKLFAKLYHGVYIQNMDLKRAQLVRIVFLQRLYDNFLIKGFLEESDEGVE